MAKASGIILRLRQVEQKVEGRKKKLRGCDNRRVLALNVILFCFELVVIKKEEEKKGAWSKGCKRDFILFCLFDMIYTAQSLEDKDFDDLAATYISHYKYNADIGPDWYKLQNLYKKRGESSKEYAQRWTAIVVQIQAESHRWGDYVDFLVHSKEALFRSHEWLSFSRFCYLDYDRWKK